MRLVGKAIIGNSHFSCIYVMSAARNPSFSALTVHRELHGWEVLRGILRINIQGGCNCHLSANVYDVIMKLELCFSKT